MRNEFDDNANFPCSLTDINSYSKEEKRNGTNYVVGCDGVNPLSQISNQSLGSSLGCLFGLYVLCYMISWWILFRLRKAHND